MAEWFVKEKVTTFQWIPSAFRQFLRTVPDDFVFQDIRIVVMASESLTVGKSNCSAGIFRSEATSSTRSAPVNRTTTGSIRWIIISPSRTSTWPAGIRYRKTGKS